MTKTKIHLLSCLIVSCLVGSQTTWGQTEPTPDPYRYQVKPETYSWEWTTEDWSASDKPFAQVRREVEIVEAKKELTPQYLNKVQNLAEQAPTDALAQFRWGYAMLRAPYVGIQLNPGQSGDYTSIRRSLARPKSPNSYSYSRLRFLLMTKEYEHPQLKVVGERLLQRNPKDTFVKTYLIPYLSISLNSQERQTALDYAQDLVAKHPKWKGAYSTLGRVYEDRLILNGDLSAADKGIAAYRKYVSLLPNDAKLLRQQGESSVRILQREKARQQKNGFTPPNVFRG